VAGRLGPEPGRYVVRRFAGDDPQQILVIASLEAPRRRRFGGRRARRADGAATPVEVTRATVIGADPLGDEEAAAAWLRDAAGPGADGVVDAARAVLERALHAYGVAAAAPAAAAPTRATALVTRVGYGTGEEVAEGRWAAARDLPLVRRADGPARGRAPRERFAALLAGRDATLGCELLAVRARIDLDAGRPREAALQLEAALAAAVEELRGWRDLPGMAARLDELAGHHGDVAAAAAAARTGLLDEPGAAAVAAALDRLESALRARTAAASP
jgi:hypothetical protein